MGNRRLQSRSGQIALATGNVLLGFITFGISAIGFALGLKDIFATDTASKVAGALASVSSLIGLGCSYQTIDFDRLLE